MARSEHDGDLIGDRAGVDATGFATSPIDQLDVNAISTIEVLKGPSAVATYGSNAANGVIIITTRRGQEGPARWNLSASVSQETMPGKWPLNYFAWGEDLVRGNGIVHCARFGNFPGAGEILNWGAFPTCRYDSTTVYQSLNNPSTTVFGTGIRKDLSITVSGGSRHITYSFTGTYRPTLGLAKLPDADVRLLEQAGIGLTSWQRRPDALDQYSGTASATFAINDQSSLTYSTLVMREDKRTTPLLQILGQSKTLPPPTALYDKNGNRVGVGSGVLVRVPTFMAERRSNSIRFNNSAQYRTTFWKTMTAEARAGIDVSNGRETYLLATGDYCPLSGSVNVAFGNCAARNNLPDPRDKAIDYTSTRAIQFVTDAHFVVSTVPKGFQWLKVTPVVGIDVNSNSNGMTGVVAGLLPVGGRGIQGAGVVFPGPDVQTTRQTAGMFAQATLNIADRMYLPFAMRTDAGNAIGRRDRTIFPRVALSYLMSDEPRFRNVPILGTLPELRVRTSFGAAGRQPGLTDKYRTYKFSQWPVENVSSDIVSVNSVGNPTLSPEISREWELGFDALFLEHSRGRWSGTFTLAQTQTSNVLMEEYLPPSLGMISTRVNNIGDAEHHTIDVTIEGLQRLGKVDWNTSNLFSMGKGRLIRLRNAHSNRTGISSVGFADVVYRAGYPIGGYWAKPVNGFVDGNGDGQIQFSEVMYGDSLRFIGVPTPRFTVTSNNSVTVASRVTITASLMYEGGSTSLSQSGSAVVLTPYSRAMNDPTISLEDQVRSRYDALSFAHQVSTLRLQSVQMTYNVQLRPIAFLLGARSLQVAVQGTNLGLWSTFSGKDPGVGGIGRLADLSVLPTPRTYGISVRIQ